jgi:peptidoglycan/xylan/chitin deacetylase (PgdA/CDA1 family)
MAALNAYGYDTVSLRDYLDFRTGSATPPDRPVILTFDDHHRSVYTMARPILNNKAMTMTFFITTNFITNIGQWESITWNEVRQFRDEGHAIESHSVNHPDLTTIPEDEAWQEILNSRLEIGDRLGAPAQFFAYPSGRGATDPVIQALVRDAGYKAAVAAWPDRLANTVDSDPWALPRIAIREDHSVDLDPEQPGLFFMRQVDPNFPLPLLTVTSWRIQSQEGAFGACFKPGEAITVEVIINNHGDPAAARVVLTLDDDDDREDTYFTDFRNGNLAGGESVTFRYNLALGNDLSPGLHSYALDIYDEHAALGFLHNGWHPAFLLSADCHSQYLPVIQR